MTYPRRLVSAILVAGVLAAALVQSRSENESTPERSRTTTPPGRHAFGVIQPRLAPDGSAIAVSWQGAICRIPRAGGALTRLTHGEGFDTEPAWSPDGRRIAFVNSPSMSGGTLKLINAVTGEEQPLPEAVSVGGTILYYKLEYHPDGQRILGMFRQDGRDYGLAWYDLQSGQVTSVARPGRWSRYALSADGQRVAYTLTRDVDGEQGGNDGPQADILVVGSEGGEPQTLGRFPARIYDLCWSDGDQELVVSTDLGSVHNDLWRVPVRASHEDTPQDLVAGAQKLTYGQADEDRPSTAAGRWLVWTDNHRHSTAIVVRDLHAGEEQTLRVALPETHTATLRLRTRDPSAGDLTARVSIRQTEGKFHAPPGALYRVLGDVGHFYCASTADVPVPPGRYELRAWHGPEFRPASQTIEVRAGEAADVTLDLERWHHAAAEGWYSGENHIHANYGYGEWYNSPATMQEQCAGEDLHVCNFMVANSDGDAVFDREFFRGRPDPLSTERTLLYWNQEFRSTIWGHMTLVNLKQIVEPVFTGFKDTTNPWDVPTNADIADRAHWQNGLVNYTHVAQNPEDPYVNPYTGKGIPVDVALGRIDSLDLNASYAGTVPLWYRLLNCGFRLPASAGTDCFLNRITSRLPGGHRVYVQIDGPLTYDAWIEGLRAGRSFVTNGPMLRFAVDNQAIGDVLERPTAAEVRITASAQAQFPLDRIEVVYNGRVVATGQPAGNRMSASIDQQIPLNDSGWLAVRATGANHPDLPAGNQYAHSSPVYVVVAGQPAGSAEDARYFVQWLDRLELAVRLRDRIPTDDLQRHVASQFEAARRVYAQIIERRR
jgi:hypothetical protein